MKGVEKEPHNVRTGHLARCHDAQISRAQPMLALNGMALAASGLSRFAMARSSLATRDAAQNELYAQLQLKVKVASCS